MVARRVAVVPRCGGPGKAQQSDARGDRREVDRSEPVGLPVDLPLPDEVALQRGETADQQLRPGQGDHSAGHPSRLAGGGDLPLTDEGIALVAHLEQSDQPALLRGERGKVARLAAQLLPDRLPGLPGDLQRVGGRERTLIGGHDRHHLGPEAGELLAEQVQMAIGDGDRRRMLGILRERDLEQAIVGVCGKGVRDRALERPARVVEIARNQRRRARPQPE